jgi:hypothetical protein
VFLAISVNSGYFEYIYGGHAPGKEGTSVEVGAREELVVECVRSCASEPWNAKEEVYSSIDC